MPAPFPRARFSESTISDAVWDRLVGEVERLGRVSYSADFVVAEGPEGTHVSLAFLAGVAIFPATITGHTGTKHAWTELNAQASTSSGGGRTGTATDNPAIDLYNRAFANGTLVFLVQSTYVDSGATKPAMAIIPIGPMPTAKNQVSIAKEDPDNASKYIPEWNWDRWRGS
jgi:hypothetical protein